MSILNELTYSPSDPVVLKDQPVVLKEAKSSTREVFAHKEAKSSTREVFAHSNTNEISNTRILRDHLESQIIEDVKFWIHSHSRVSKNFCMFVNFVSMIEPKNIINALKEADWIKVMHDELDKFERHPVSTLVPKPQGKTIIGTRWVFRNKIDEDGIVIRKKS